jgi:glycosyltransferase involved in cell wall biosynthesis
MCLNYLNKTKTSLNFNIFNFKLNIYRKIPKITVIIPIYNCQKSIELSLTSILNQNMKDFEIILVNDNSSDNSLNIINKIKKVDNRIKIINNLKNMGTLYSRCIGALNAKGKYIFPLDNDDLFLDEDVFETIYNFASDDKYDIVEFKTFAIPNYHPQIKDIEEYYFNSHPNNLILHQPELGIFPIFRNNTFGMNDYNIWAKCIKTNLYQKSVNTLGKKRYSIYNCWTEDISIIFIIFNLANSFIFLNKYGIFHLNSIKTATFTLHPDHKTFTEIFLLDIIFEILKERKKYKEFIVLKAYDVFNKIENQTLTEGNKYFLISILQKIINYKYINEKHKILIKEKFSKFIS